MNKTKSVCRGKNDCKPVVSVGLMSGLNYGSEGCREGLWLLAANTFRKEKVDFVLMIGGLVDRKAILEKLKDALAGCDPKEKHELTEGFIKKHAQYLEINFPRVYGRKTYIITSPAYDGKIGERIARRLAELRKDVLLYRDGGDRLEIKHIRKVIGAYAPKKGVMMRSDYFDTPVLRVLKDEYKRSTRGIGDINFVGCYASSIFHPGDSSDIQHPYASLPVLYKITDTRTSENQIGVRVMKCYSNDLKESILTNHSFKDEVSNEWSLVQAPPDSTRIQKIIVDEVKNRGPLTIGQLVDFTMLERKVIRKALKGLVERRTSKTWPGFYMDKVSKRYYFTAQWFQQKLAYPPVKYDRTDSILAFGCLHAACKHTDMKFFRDEVPKIMLAQDIYTICGAGDFIEGLKHDLMVKGEVYGSRKYAFNYTRQEQLAAYLVSQVQMQVFMSRFGPFLNSVNARKVTRHELENRILNALPTFLYIAGNHCEWTAPLGFDPLSVFGIQLRNLLTEDIILALAQAKIYLPSVAKLVSSRAIELHQNEPYVLPSGLSVAMLHPYMSRTKTTSIRPQEMLGKAKTEIVIGANFHVAESVEQWEYPKGQRACLQVGTLKHSSGFEDTKLKTVDFGVGILKVHSIDKRIKINEVGFPGTKTANMEKANEAILNDFDRRLGLD